MTTFIWEELRYTKIQSGPTSVRPNLMMLMPMLHVDNLDILEHELFLLACLEGHLTPVSLQISVVMEMRKTFWIVHIKWLIVTILNMPV